MKHSSNFTKISKNLDLKSSDEKVEPYRWSLDTNGIERKVWTQVPSKQDFNSGKESYNFTSCYPRHAYIFNIRPHSITATGRSAGGGHEILCSGRWNEALDLLSREIDTAALFELRGLGQYTLVAIIRNKRRG